MASHRNLVLTAMLACTTALASTALAAPPESADTLFAHAKAKALSEHKHVLLEFSDSFCPYCKLYDRFLEDPEMKPITDKAFVVEHIDMDKTPGALGLRSALGAARNEGFPFLAMTSGDGNLIVNSYRGGNTTDNIGYPALPEEIDWYIEMLKRAAPSLSHADLAATHTWLQKHAPH